MSEYLDRKQVIELYEKYHPSLATHVYELGEKLRTLPTVTIPVAELDTTKDFAGWIPCSERLPERGGYFLITNIDELVRFDCFRTSTNDFDNYSAIAWMPLPKPYKEEGDSN